MTTRFMADASAAPVDGLCGAANEKPAVKAPTENLCASGTASAVIQSGLWKWYCAGSGGGMDALCWADFSSEQSPKAAAPVLPVGPLGLSTTR